MKTEIDKLKRFRKKNHTAQQGSPRRQMSVKKDKPKWFVNNETPSDVKETRQWNNNMWLHCCEESGGKCKDKWHQHEPSKFEGLAFIPEHKRKNTTADIKKVKRLKLTKTMQSLMEQVNHEDIDEDSQE